MEESRLKKSGRNIITAFLQNFLSIILSFLSRIIFIRILDVSYLGINGLFSNILNILSLADMGITTAMMYSLYKPIAENDKGKINALIGYFRKIYHWIAMTVLVLGMAMIPFLKYIINLPTYIDNIYIYYLIALINVVISYLFVYRTTLLNADQKNYILNNYIILFRVVTFLCQIIVLVLFENYLLYLLVALILSFVSNLVQNNVTIHNYPYLREQAGELEKKEKKAIFKNVKALFMYRICGVIQNNTDNILTSIYVGTIYVGYYSNYMMLVNTVIVFLGLVFNNMKASIGNFLNEKKSTIKEKQEIFWILEFVNFWLVSFIAICFVCLFQDFISLFFGSEFVLEFPVVIALTANFYTSNIRQNIWAFRETTGIFHETRHITLITAVLNLIISIILGKRLGLFGIIIGTVIARLVYAWWKEPQILFGRYFKESSKRYYLNYCKNALLLILNCAMTYCFCSCLMSENLWINFIIKIIVCLVVPNLLYVFLWRKREEFIYVFDRIVRPIMSKVQCKRN